MWTKFLVPFLMVFAQMIGHCQTDSTTIRSASIQKPFLKQSIVPLALIGSGLIINYSNGIIGKENLQDQIVGGSPDFHTNVDDFLLFVPTISMYTADILKVKSENNAFTQTKILAISLVATNAITFGIKQLSAETRPNGEDESSFPSGHTSNAFVMATVLFHEFKRTKPVLAYSGFLFASATGALRVLNNEHWVSDVMVGAGLGILVTDLVYRFEPFKNWDPFKNDRVTTFISPSYFDKGAGIYANIQF